MEAIQQVELYCDLIAKTARHISMLRHGDPWVQGESAVVLMESYQSSKVVMDGDVDILSTCNSWREDLALHQHDKPGELTILRY